MGPPGVGKGTQAELLRERLGYVPLSSGVLLRRAVDDGGALGRIIGRFMERGQLVPDRLMFSLVRSSLRQITESGSPFVLDGIPRSVAQVELLEQVLGRDAITAVFELTTDTANLLARVDGRARGDDDPEVVAARIRSYENDTAPVLQRYERMGRLVHIDGSGSVEVVHRALVAAMERFPTRAASTDAATIGTR